ncbi:MAG: helix-turn-helix domain-containing protein [Actinomycetota bacterium]|nr:helix-turn-helix domain-containing protein [Actinomycetota bacterium]MDP9454640.1 helix-turn-helix domain-containing protein [Actinomycetota bacterium]
MRILRGERGLSMRSAADLCGVTKETLSALERGAREPHDPTLAKIAKGYGVPFEELLEEPVPLGEAPEAGPNVETARETPPLDDPLIVEWLRGHGLAWGTTTDAGFEEHVRGLDLEEVDEDGRPVAVMELGRAVTDEQDKARDFLWTPSKYRSLGSRLSVDPDAPVAEQKLQRHDRLRELRWDLDRRYRRRAYALMRYAELLVAQKEGAAENSGFEPEPAATTQEGLWNQAVEEYAA